MRSFVTFLINDYENRRSMLHTIISSNYYYFYDRIDHQVFIFTIVTLYAMISIHFAYFLFSFLLVFYLLLFFLYFFIVIFLCFFFLGFFFFFNQFCLRGRNHSSSSTWGLERKLSSSRSVRAMGYKRETLFYLSLRSPEKFSRPTCRSIYTPT